MGATKTATNYKLFVNEERTVFVRVWEATGAVEVATREHPADIWGAPVLLTEEPAA